MATTHPAPVDIPELPSLLRTNLPDRILNMLFGSGVYGEPTQFQLTTAARLLDKALVEWDAARAEFGAHEEVRDGLPPVVQSRNPGGTRALFRAIGNLENVVDSLHRLCLLLKPLEKEPALAALAHLPLPAPAERKAVREFRNRIQHGDEDIVTGKAGKGLATATLRPNREDIELQGQHVRYDDMARMLEQLHDFIRAAGEK
jgi:hypothetical protein